MVFLIMLLFLEAPLPRSSRLTCLLLFLTTPPLIMIDHGHYQFNSVALGLVVWAVAFLHARRFLLASIAFTLSILYKQTMLHFSPAFFFFLLGVSLNKRRGGVNGNIWKDRIAGVLQVACIGATVIATSLVVVYPLLIGGMYSSITSISFIEKIFKWLGLSSLIPMWRRIFPFERGIYEDYVANFWVFTSPIFRFRNLSKGNGRLILLSSAFTMCSFAPSSIDSFMKSSIRRS